MKNKQVPYLIYNAILLLGFGSLWWQTGHALVAALFGMACGIVPFNLVTYIQNEIDAARQEMNDNGWHIDRNKVRYRLIREIEQPYLETTEDDTSKS